MERDQVERRKKKKVRDLRPSSREDKCEDLGVEDLHGGKCRR